MKVQRTFCSFGEPKDPGSASRLSEPQFSELKMKVSDHHGSIFALSARGDFGGEPRGSTPKSVFPMLAPLFGSRIFGSSSQSLQPLAPSLSPSCDILFYGYGRVYLLLLLFRPLRSPMRRSWNPPLSTCFATAQFTKALFRLCA